MTMELSHAQKQALHRDGFVHLPGVVPQVMVERARRLINHSLGELGMERAQLPILRAQSYCPELRKEPELVDLFLRTPVMQLVESAVGAGKVIPPADLQMALRFPVLSDPAPAARPHVDGVASATNGVSAGKVHHFTGLLGVLLSDLPGPDAGNFTVWPGTHETLAEYFRQHGPLSLLSGALSKIAMPQPHQIIGRAGDVVLCHYLLAHGITPNSSPNIRYAAFFRFFHVDHDRIGDRCMTEPWLEWEGMREVAAGPTTVRVPAAVY
jgi:hypothetical protein